MSQVGEHIARLQNPEVRCLDCAADSWGVPLFLENVYPYRQSCHKCGKLLCEGQSKAWCELFPKTVRFRIKRGDDSFAGGEFYAREHAHAWARQHVGGFYTIVSCDVHGNELAPVSQVLEALKEKIRRVPWHSGVHLDVVEVGALRTALGLSPE